MHLVLIFPQKTIVITSWLFRISWLFCFELYVRFKYVCTSLFKVHSIVFSVTFYKCRFSPTRLCLCYRLILFTFNAGGLHFVHIVDTVGVVGTFAIHEAGNDIYGDGEDDGTVVLGRDTVQSLEIPQLKFELSSGQKLHFNRLPEVLLDYQQ